ncbi:MAG: NIPSNAP family protein [Chloroflexi bacterium]|nr:NIPSNAP family protein [Chloroflexota bacterium]
MKHLVEFRSYTLKTASRDEFHQLIVEQSMPMLERWGVDVVDFGPSAHDSDSYYLIRRYDSLAHREQSQDAFYGSDEWKQGPREAILALIETHTSFVLELDEVTVNGLRRKNWGRFEP